MRIATTLLVAAFLAGCGEDDGGGATPLPEGPATELEIRFDDGRGESDRATLRCGEEPEADGYLAEEDAAALCDAVAALDPPLTQEPPAQRACTQIFGGPQTAQVTGTLDGEAVSRRFSRTNGCEIADWDALAKAGLLPGA